jgi:hypothetical protein
MIISCRAVLGNKKPAGLHIAGFYEIQSTIRNTKYPFIGYPFRSPAAFKKSFKKAISYLQLKQFITKRDANYLILSIPTQRNLICDNLVWIVSLVYFQFLKCINLPPDTGNPVG